MARYKVVAGSQINLDHSDFEVAKNVSDLKKLDVFGHLSKTDQEAAYKELLDALKGKTPDPVEEVK